MANNVYNLKNVPSMPERILSALAYLTFGTIGIVLIIASAIMKTNLKPFMKFNAYQAILFGVLFFFVQMTYQVFSAIIQFLQFIPFIGKLLNSFFQFVVYYLMSFPVLFGFSIVAALIIIIVLYLTVLSLCGKLPYIPFISDSVKRLV